MKKYKKSSENIRTKKKYLVRPWVKQVARVLVLAILVQVAAPTVTWALTSGPQQPEASNFTPADVSNLVDPFTGDFSYNIPMFDIGGYPVNLSYNSGASMDQEATWTGLGWNLNTGAITRDVRGLPDDFWGDEIKRTVNTKPNITAGGSVTVGFEIAGFDPKVSDGGGSVSYGLQMKYNNYAGFSIGQTLNGGVQFPSGTNINLGLSTTNGGLDINPNVSFSHQIASSEKHNYKGSLGFGLNINSRTGLSQMNLNANVSASNKEYMYLKLPKMQNAIKIEDKSKSNTNSVSAGGGGVISFLNPTFTPQNSLPYQNFNFSGNFKIGGAVSFGDISGTIAGFYSEQRLMTNTIINPAYGYVYSEKGQYVTNATHDFNREKDGAFTNNTPSLPLTNYTYDAFNIKAQGIGGSFRAFRNDVGHVFDPDMANPSAGGSFGLEVDLGATVDFGVDLNVNWNESKSGKWKNENPAKDQLSFREKQTNTLAENVFFKLVGEKVSESDNAFANTIQEDKAVAVNLEAKNDPMSLNQLKSDHPTRVTNLSNNNQRNSRIIRNTLIQCFTVAEVKKAFPGYVKYLPAEGAPDHHIAMIIATSPDGTRYVFGLPAYNKVKREVTMAVGTTIDGVLGYTNDTTTNLVSYGSAEAGITNRRGIDNYYDVTETPAFVHTWYLTEVLSPDYSDLTGDGPTADDLGGYVKFSYGIERGNGTVYPNIPGFKWRTPSTGSTYKATFNKGLESIKTDDKATYLYGEKDIWYPNTMESKTQLVKFDYSDRADGYGVTGEHGATGGPAQAKIEKINIYSRQDYVANPGTAIPLKTIHFEYDYSLCAGVWNNDGVAETVDGNDINLDKGKLTLKKVYFTYRNSNKAKYSAYSFGYPTTSAGNPDYDPTANDRWGSYRKNGSIAGLPRNEDFPYTYRDKTEADKSAACWNLQSITLPTGGRIDVEYESDDYAYVQDRKACRMFQVVGASSTNSGAYSSNLFTRNGLGVITNNNYLIFDLETPVSSTTLTDDDKKIKEMYFDHPAEPEPKGPSKFLYFRFFTNVNNATEAATDPANEYVSGYADVEVDNSRGSYCGVYTPSLSSGSYTQGWVKLKEPPRDGGGSPGYNPISKTGWSFSRINTPFYANNQPTPGEDAPGDLIKTILNADIIAQLIDFFKGPNNKLESNGFSSKFSPTKSWIRMYEPDGIKYGGGHRVKKITINDNWKNMEGNEDGFDYGQEYAYNMEDGSSSGVASYEPMYGADENPFRIPVFYDKNYGPLIPDDRFYQEEPFGESFFPSPSVGYSRVKIMNLQRENVTRTATGYTLKEFYTAKDYPTLTQRTDLNVRRSKIDPVLAIISPYVFDFMTASQGFVIELNDMHGKSKKESVYQEGNDQEPISYIEHFYQHDVYDETQVGNLMPVLEKNGDVTHREIGTEIDMVSDFRESGSTAGNIDIGFNTDYMQFGPVPLIILAVFPKIKLEETRFRSASVTKVVNRYGIETHTEAVDLGSQVKTENKLYNGISGEVLSTQVNNEYNDDRYTLSVPAYWAYEGMGHASNNAGFEMQSPGNWNYTTGEITMTNAEDYFEPGDEVMRSNFAPGRMIAPYNNSSSNYYGRLWVAKDNASGKLYFIDLFGQIYTDVSNPSHNIIFKVIRSGHRNILSPKISEFATLEPPVSDFTSGSFNITNSSKVLSVSAQTFQEQWKGLKRYDECLPYSQCVCTEAEWTPHFSYLVKYVVENNINLTSSCSLCTPEIRLYENNMATTPLNTYLVNYWADKCNVTLPYAPIFTITFEKVGSYGADWAPLDDPLFVNGTNEYVFGFNWLITACPPCSDYGISIIDEEDIPAAYFGTPGCSDLVDGVPATDILYIPVTINGNAKAVKVRLIGGSSSSCPPFRTCEVVNLLSNDNNVGDVVNPYIYNILGKWRGYQAFTLIEEREGNMASNIDLRSQGAIDGYSKFWEISGGIWQVYGAYDQGHWKRTTTMTQYHPSGPQIEEKNALDIYSAALYGYYEQLAVAVAQNAHYKDIGFDGFEDYTYLDEINGFSTCKTSHFKFDNNAGDIVSTQFHTGKHSLSVDDKASMFRLLQPATMYRNSRDVPYTLKASDLTEFFGPTDSSLVDQRFIFSFWVKQSNFTPVIFDYTQVMGDIKLGLTSLIVGGSLKKSPVIEGWQKFEYEFIIPAMSTGTLEIKLFTDEVVTGYFDDIRIQPFNSMMKSYVYDPLDLRFMAELDENNYATFYEYDEDGALVRVKKETERGIMTIQENRYRSFKYE